MPIKRINKNNIRPYFSPKFSFSPKENKKVEKKEPPKQFFKVGKTYSLSGVSCDDFEMPSKEYQLIAVVPEVNGMELDSVIMKQISGESGTIFSLTKADCRLLNIPFQPGLQLFPKNLDWKENRIEVVEEQAKIEEKPKEMTIFDVENMSTYPVNYEDRTVRHIMVEISGCDYFPNGDIIVLPNNIKIRKGEFLSKLKVRTMRPLYGNGVTSANFTIAEDIIYRLMTSEVSHCATNEVVDVNGNIYIELCLAKQQASFTTQKTIDGYIGIKPIVFDGQDFNEIFDLVFFIPNEYGYVLETKKNINNEMREVSTVLNNLLDDVRGLSMVIPYDSDISKLTENVMNKYSRNVRKYINKTEWTL